MGNSHIRLVCIMAGNNSSTSDENQDDDVYSGSPTPTHEEVIACGGAAAHSGINWESVSIFISTTFDEGKAFPFQSQTFLSAPTREENRISIHSSLMATLHLHCVLRFVIIYLTLHNLDLSNKMIPMQIIYFIWSDSF